MAVVSPVREYYRAIDAGEYDTLTAVLAEGFVHDRPDRTIEGSETFVRFMREERPRTETTHDLEAFFRADDRAEVAVAGRLLDAEGEVLFRFLDRHAIDGDAIASIKTYTD